jgi:hypothetical protein
MSLTFRGWYCFQLADSRAEEACHDKLIKPHAFSSFLPSFILYRTWDVEDEISVLTIISLQFNEHPPHVTLHGGA